MDESLHGETAQLAATLHDIVFRMNPAQLRELGQDLLHVYQAIQGDNIPLTKDGSEPAKRDYPALLRRLVADLDRKPPRGKANALDRRLDWLADTTGMTEIDRQIIGIAARVAIFDVWSSLARIVCGNLASELSSGVIASLTGLPSAEIDRRLHPGAMLNRMGLVDVDQDGTCTAGEMLKAVARSSATNGRELAMRLTPPPGKPTLQWHDFNHLEAERDVAERLVRSGQGASILLYGPPGTGKTEFAMLLARRVGAQAIFAGEADAAGGEPLRFERIGHFTLLRSMMRNDAKRIVVLDEADDILLMGSERDRNNVSKIWLNNLVESAERPTIYILNRQDMLEESLIRRMDLAIGFPLPSLAVRERIVRRHARRNGVRLGKSDVHRLASLPAAPAVIGKALSGARRADGENRVNDAILIGEGLTTAITGHVPPPFRLPDAYDPALALADCDLGQMADQLVRAPDTGWSLLLSGPSGTGKSAYARHLADRLGIELIERRGSDLLGMFVGQTEANIAAAFGEARRARGMLLIDEADDFLFDRRQAQRGWERSMVNEMLRQMEALQAPFAATTNLAEQLDPATRRRFTLHAAFRVLDPGRAARLFRNWFGSDLPTGETLHGQTPGDFAVVARIAKLLGVSDPVRVLAWLREESEARGEGRSAMGFAA